MEFILSRVTQQAMNYAIRSGIIITSSFAIEQCSRLLKTKDGKERDELQELQKRLESKIRIIAPAIDMIELITARGNTSLESAVTLTKALRWDIQALGVRLSNAAANEEVAKRGKVKAESAAEGHSELKKIMVEMRKLLERIEDAVPLINLAITTSGVSLSTSLPSTVSPSRLLQASTFLSAGDASYTSQEALSVQIGPTFTLSMYMLFVGHTTVAPDEESLRSSTWKEVIHKAHLKLLRTSIEQLNELPFRSSDGAIDEHTRRIFEEEEVATMRASVRKDEYAYQLFLVEDLDDGRVHTVEEDGIVASSFADVEEAGIRTVIPIHEISKLFYADTGKILNIGSDGETNNPILLLKRDPNAVPPRRMAGNEGLDRSMDHEEDSGDVESQLDAQIQRETSEQPERPNLESANQRNSKWEVTPDLDPEWIALEVYNEDAESENNDDDDFIPEGENSTPNKSWATREDSVDPAVTTALSNLRIASSPPEKSTQSFKSLDNQRVHDMSSPLFDSKFTKKNVQTSLSLLEMLIRLTSLQQFQQTSHLTINDELLNFFLRESSTTGAPSGDAEARQRIRMDARMRLGFDPYDESPIKPHGEDYQTQTNQGYRNEPAEGWDSAWSSHGRSPPSASSPLLLRSRESASPSTRFTRSSSPLVGGIRSSMTSLNTPPATGKSKQSRTVEDIQHLSEARGSPLSRSGPKR